ncbi:hypothetical protein ACFSTI_01330 [Rhizorhabdus histidinilytica]|jgi:hypothetical protein
MPRRPVGIFSRGYEKDRDPPAGLVPIAGAAFSNSEIHCFRSAIVKAPSGDQLPAKI